MHAGYTRKAASPRGEVGEIDTTAPFQSVKAAVSLFGEVAFHKDRFSIKRRSSENVFEKETQLVLAQKELSKIKKQLDNAETAKAKALSDLEKARMTLKNLTRKLSNMRESKQSVINAAQAVQNQGKQLEKSLKSLSVKAIGFEAWKREVENARKKYTVTINELDASKQDLTKIRQDFDAALEAKLAALQAAVDAQRSAKLNSERISELSSEIANMKVRASIEQMKLSSEAAEQEEQQSNVTGQREAQLGFYRSAKEGALEKLQALKSQYDPELVKSLDAKLAEASAEIEALHEQMRKIHASEMETVRIVTAELKEATKTLQDIVAEENSLKNLVYTLRQELKHVKKEQDEVREKEQAAADLASSLAEELQGSMAMAKPKPGSEEEKEAETYYEQSLQIRKLKKEADEAKREAEEMSRKAQELKQEAENSRAVSEEQGIKLQIAMKEAKEAKASEQRALVEMEHLAEVQARVTNSKTGARIKLSKNEYETMNEKIKKCEDLVHEKEAAAKAELQAICMRKNEVEMKVQANLKAIQEIKAATEMALWHAEMADSAKEAFENELMRWRQQKQKSDVSSKMMDFSESSSRSVSLSI
ncbi:hypothetical protein HN51_002885 [Arachis hypogaea]|uniref:WEB family protein n=1 Tax=Arachis hypogaea TaxID=3818 RepID=A0A445EL56_ARAHY|nr:WEB family protein At1g12150 [Arachis hypogaea]QHO51141.1 WEB family protein [Arachis hypogaea]QHO51142.1 WEB family protein [Arachis hypogaea]RYR76063.1 hypothetical protein Ahy_A01g000655 [Arachis hypogaea]